MRFSSVLSVLTLASTAFAIPHNFGKRDLASVLAGASLLNGDVGTLVCVITRDTFIAAAALGSTHTMPFCAAFPSATAVPAATTPVASTSTTTTTTSTTLPRATSTTAVPVFVLFTATTTTTASASTLTISGSLTTIPASTITVTSTSVISLSTVSATSTTTATSTSFTTSTTTLPPTTTVTSSTSTLTSTKFSTTTTSTSTTTATTSTLTSTTLTRTSTTTATTTTSTLTSTTTSTFSTTTATSITSTTTSTVTSTTLSTTTTTATTSTKTISFTTTSATFSEATGTIQLQYAQATASGAPAPSSVTFFYPNSATTAYPTATNLAAALVMPATNGKCKDAPTTYDYRFDKNAVGSPDAPAGSAPIYLGAEAVDNGNSPAKLLQLSIQSNPSATVNPTDGTSYDQTSIWSIVCGSNTMGPFPLIPNFSTYTTPQTYLCSATNYLMASGILAGGGTAGSRMAGVFISPNPCTDGAAITAAFVPASGAFFNTFP